MIAIATTLALWFGSASLSGQLNAQRYLPDDVYNDRSIWGFACKRAATIDARRVESSSLPGPDEWLVIPRAQSSNVESLIADYVVTRSKTPPTIAGVPTNARVEADAWEKRTPSEIADATCAFTRVASPQDEVRMARLVGARLLFVNGEGFIGDPDRRGFQGVPVALKKGWNDVFVFDANEGIELEFWKPASRIVIGTWDVEWAREDDDHMIDSDYVSVPAFNASTEGVGGLHWHYGHARVPTSCPLRVTDWRDGARLLPLGISLQCTPTLNFDACDTYPTSECAHIPLSAYAGVFEHEDRRLIEIPPPREHASGRSSGDRSGSLDRKVRSRDASSLEGTLFSQLSRPVYFVVGTRGEDQEIGALMAQARFDQQRLWYQSRIVPAVMTDITYVQELRSAVARDGSFAWILRSDVVLYGNEDNNAAWSEILPKELPIHVHSGSLSLFDSIHEGDDVAGWFVYPRAAARSNALIVAIASTGALGSRLGYLLESLLHRTREHEFAFYDGEILDCGLPRTIGAGSF